MFEQLHDNSGLSYQKEKMRFEGSFRSVMGTETHRTFLLLPSFTVNEKSGKFLLDDDVEGNKPHSILDVGISHRGWNVLRMRPFQRVLMAGSIAGVFMEQHATDTADSPWIYKVTRFDEDQSHGLKEYIAQFHSADVAEFYSFRTLLDSLYAARTDICDPHFNSEDFSKLGALDLLAPIIPDCRISDFNPREFK